MKINKKALTLAELLVVIVIIALLLLISSTFNFNKKTDIEKRDWFINKITTTFKNNYTNSIVWKWTKSGSTLIVMDYNYVRFSSWMINSFGVQWTNTYTWEQLNYPFFNDKWFVIKNIEYKNKDESTWSLINETIDIIFKNGNITFSWWIAFSTGIILNITAWYHWDYKNIIFDRRTGKINVN